MYQVFKDFIKIWDRREAGIDTPKRYSLIETTYTQPNRGQIKGSSPTFTTIMSKIWCIISFLHFRNKLPISATHWCLLWQDLISTRVFNSIAGAQVVKHISFFTLLVCLEAILWKTDYIWLCLTYTNWTVQLLVKSWVVHVVSNKQCRISADTYHKVNTQMVCYLSQNHAYTGLT